jgi:hypothetical protein
MPHVHMHARTRAFLCLVYHHDLRNADAYENAQKQIREHVLFLRQTYCCVLNTIITFYVILCCPIKLTRVEECTANWHTHFLNAFSVVGKYKCTSAFHL